LQTGFFGKYTSGAAVCWYSHSVVKLIKK